MNNQVQEATQPKFSTFITSEKVKENIANVLVGKENEFVANMVSLVNNNPKLAECENRSILNCGIVATTLNLPLDPNLGLAYAIPYKTKSKKDDNGKWIPGKTKAQFQIGYKGLIQLAYRSGQFEDIGRFVVKEGEIAEYDFMTGKHTYKWIQDPKERNAAKTIGYGAYYILKGNLTKKALFWSVEEVENHADEYSTAFELEIKRRIDAGETIKDEKGNDVTWKYSSPWYTNFTRMAQKTVLKALLKDAPLSIAQLDVVLKYDQAVIPELGVAEYVDNAPENTNEIEYQVEEQTERKEAKEITFDDEKAPDQTMTPSKKMEEAAAEYWGNEGE